MRTFGRRVWVMRVSTPDSVLRTDRYITPWSHSSHSTFGMTAICCRNCTPLKRECRITTWKGSITFSKFCSQL